MASSRSILLICLFACVLSSTFSMPYFPDEDDDSLNELAAGEDLEEIPDDEDLLEVDASKFEDFPKEDTEEDDLEGEDEEEDAEEDEGKEDEDEEDEDEEEQDAEDDIDSSEGKGEEVDEEDEDIDEKVDTDEDDEDEEEGKDEADEEELPEEEAVPYGGFDGGDIDDPGFFISMYEKAKEFAKGLGGK